MMKRITPEMLEGLTELFVDTFNAPPWNDLWTQILEFCVANDRKGQGIGAEMMKQFTDYLDKKGITAVYLLTMRSSSGEDFYLKQGFKTISEMCVMSKRYGT